MMSDEFSAIFDLLTMSDNIYPITSDVWGLFWTPLPTLKLDVIYGRSLSSYPWFPKSVHDAKNSVDI